MLNLLVLALPLLVSLVHTAPGESWPRARAISARSAHTPACLFRMLVCHL